MSTVKALEIRGATATDHSFLTARLVDAAFWRPDAERPSSVDDAVRAADLAVYLDGWGRRGDRALIAEVNGERVGAAWYRLFTDLEHGHGYLDAATPEVAIAVARGWRSRGIGRALLYALLAQAALDGHRRLSLSVEPDNAARGLYESMGFEKVEEVGGAWIMTVSIMGADPPPSKQRRA